MCRRPMASRCCRIPKTSIIMIGPGTAWRRSAPSCSIAAHGAHPARTGCSRPSAQRLRFLLRRRTQRHEDFGLLTRLSLAWSRDGDKKFYVQDRMREVGRELWTCLPRAPTSMSAATPSGWPRMSSALVDIVAQFGARTTDEAVSFVGELKKQGRSSRTFTNPANWLKSG